MPVNALTTPSSFQCLIFLPRPVCCLPARQELTVVCFAGVPARLPLLEVIAAGINAELLGLPATLKLDSRLFCHDPSLG